MEDVQSTVITYITLGVKTSARGVTLPLPLSEKNISIYSMYPNGCKSTYNFESLLALLKKYKDQMKADAIEENSKQYINITFLILQQ